MNVYQHQETGRICIAYSLPSDRYLEIGQECEKCGALNSIYEESSYCTACRLDYHNRSAAIRENERFSERFDYKTKD